MVLRCHDLQETQAGLWKSDLREREVILQKLIGLER